ncbi:MAG: outer membrane beta-barrel protein [Imperialibacter sp.]|uniref:outer membrane beta-barrel protein n=1 Tax=Imperialibacter sp. TaxID=2038411 RepID=UPI0032F07B45
MRLFRIFIFIAACLSEFSVSGQEIDKAAAAPTGGSKGGAWGYFGLRGGGHFSQVLFSDTFRPVNMQTSFVYGKQYGAVGKLFLAEHAGIQVEVNYIEKGYKQLFDSGFYSTKMNYVEVPLLMNAYLGKQKTQFFVNMGPYLEIFINQKDDLLGLVQDGEEFYRFNPKVDRTMGYGLRASGGLNRLFSFGLIQLEGGLEVTISDMIFSNRLISTIPDSSKHLVGFVSLAYMIPIGKKPDTDGQ